MIPTPTYGNHGGFFKESKKKPIDEMDCVFEIHDRELELAYNRWQLGIKEANERLLKKLDFITPPKSLYGKLYLKMSKFIFKIG